MSALVTGMTCTQQKLCRVCTINWPLMPHPPSFCNVLLEQTHMQGGAAELASVATPRKPRFFQDFEKAAASLPVSPSASLPASPVHRAPAARAPINPAAAMPAPFVALRWVGLGLHARAAHNKLQQLSVTLARCAVQCTVPSPAQDPVSLPFPILDEVKVIYPLCFLCCNGVPCKGLGTGFRHSLGHGKTSPCIKEDQARCPVIV